MRISIICCPFKTSFGSYARSLKTELEKKTGETVQWIGSNCGCGDPAEVGRQFLLPKNQCDYFEMPIVGDFRTAKHPWKRYLKSIARDVLIPLKAKRYASLAKGAEIVHFQQILDAYGSKAVFAWLQQLSKASKIVTVHELDHDQLENPESNQTYNLANAVIVHCQEMREHLINLGVQPEKIHVLLWGIDLPLPEQEHVREGIVFYGGHKLLTNKGLVTLFKAMSIIRKQMAADTPILKIHGHYGSLPEAARRMAAEHGIADKVVWLEHISDEEMVCLCQHSQLCVLPYTGSFAGLPASQAAACRLPVVCTRRAGLPDHLGELGIWVDENNAGQLAERITELLGNEAARKEIGSHLRKRAEALLRWDVIAEQTLKIYHESLRDKYGLGLEEKDELRALAI
jgi:glycosyltransferase involved in cell wall biosynthesis